MVLKIAPESLGLVLHARIGRGAAIADTRSAVASPGVSHSSAMENAPLLATAADGKLTREVHASRRRSAVAVALTLIACAGCALAVLARTPAAFPGSRLGWEVTADFMQQAEKFYENVPEGVTKLDVLGSDATPADVPNDAEDAPEEKKDGEDPIPKGREEGQAQDQGRAPHGVEEKKEHAPPAPVDLNGPVNSGFTSQPMERLTTPNPKHVKTLAFSPCAKVNEQKAQWTKSALKDQCVVNAAECEYCAWVLKYDSEYRVNDIVSLQGLNYKLTSQSLLTRPEYEGTILRRMLDRKPVHPLTGEIMWREDDREEAQANFEFVLGQVKKTDCGSTGSDTLLVHLRAGDSIGQELKAIPDTDFAVSSVVEYAKAHPEIKRVEISGVLHFGVPPPDDPFYQSKGGYEVVKDDSGLPAYRLTDELLEKNGFVLNRFFREIRAHGLEVWFTSSNNPDTDMCRYAKACHFMSADRVEFASNAQLGSAYSRNSFSDLLNDLHYNLKHCATDPKPKSERGEERDGDAAIRNDLFL